MKLTDGLSKLTSPGGEAPATNAGNQGAQQSSATPPAATPPVEPDSLASLARRSAAGGDGPTTPAATDKQDDFDFSISDDAFPDHDAFKGLVKPAKDARRGEHIAYVKKVGEAWRAYGHSQREEREKLEKNLGERSQEVEQFRGRVSEFEKKITGMTELEKRAAEAERRLAMMDIQYDPEFQRRFVDPIREREASIDSVLNLAGAQKPALFRALSEAVAKPDAEFYPAALAAMRGVIPDAMQGQVITELRSLRGLYVERTKALEKAPDAKAFLERERTESRRTSGERWLSDTYRRLEEDMLTKSSGIRVLLEDPSVKALLEPHKGTLGEINANFPRVVRAAAERLGGDIPDELMSYALLGKEMLPMMFVNAEMLRSYESMRSELEETKRALQVELQRKGGGDGGGGGNGESEPTSMAEIARLRTAGQ